MEIKNLFTPEAQQFWSQLWGIARKITQPLEKPIQDTVSQFKQKVQPAIQWIQDTINTGFVEPIMKPIKRNEKIGKVNKFLASKGITVDDIKNLAEADWSDPEEALQFFRDNGIQIQGMDSMQDIEAKQQEMAKLPTDFSNRGLSVDPNYKPVNVLWDITSQIPKFQSQPDEWFWMSAAKMVWNLPWNALQVAGWIWDIGLSYLRNLDQWPIDSLTETAKSKIINPTYQQALWVADIASKWYSAGEKWKLTAVEWWKEINAPSWVKGTAGAMDALLNKWIESVVESPVSTIATIQWLKNIPRGANALKTAGTEAMKGNIGKATSWLAKSTWVWIKENIIDPIKMWVTAPLTLGKLWAQWIKAISDKTGIKAPEWVRNFSNSAAEKMLASQWKLTKPVRKELEGKIWQSWPKFALENDLVGKDIESTADNAGKFKIDKIKEKIEAVKTFWKAETPWVAKNVAQVLKSDIESSVQKSYWKWNTQKVLDENHPELASVYRLADEITKSDKIDFVKLEQLKELHDYLNPENIQYDISGKPISETRNMLSAGKRQKLQQILESEWQKRGIDIKKINTDIQGAYTLEKWLNDTVGRIANLNILWLWDTQTAVISSILWWAPWAVGWLLLKKWLTSEWFIWGLAKSLYSKKNVTTNNSNPSGSMTPPISRLGRIMNNNSDTVTPKVKWITKKNNY